MRFILGPESPAKNYQLRRADLDKIFETIKFAPLDRKRELQAYEFIKNNYETVQIHAPFIPLLTFGHPIRFEGKHRLHALKKLGCKEIAVGVHKLMDTKYLEFLL